MRRCRIKRNSTAEDPSSKKAKLNRAVARSWEQELTLMVKEKCNVDINEDISGLIHCYSDGWWEACCHCGDQVDAGFICRMIGMNSGEIELYCDDCYPWNFVEVGEYVFTDHEQEDM